MPPESDSPESASPEPAPVGLLLRTWRQRRRLSQLALACDADISQRHLSFVESGRALPSREMILHLAEQLDIPLRDRNALLVAAGFAPVYRERPLSDPALQSARKAVDLVLTGHEPWPALAVDRRWTLVTANRAVAPLLAGAEAALLQPPVNVLRLSLHPAGLAPRIVNLTEWRSHVLARLQRQVEVSADRVLADLLRELRNYPSRDGERRVQAHNGSDGAAGCAGVVVPLQIASESGVLSFISATTVFGTPVDITLSELAIESFFPVDTATADVMRRLVKV
jgi:transcriptional regulator with XRE-family HTH domain